MGSPIYTDGNGRPLPPRPAAPPADASPAEHIAWQRADAEWDNMIRSMANKAFDRAFCKALKQEV